MADLMEVIAATESLATFVAAIEAVGLSVTLKGPGPFTLFAPIDEAFARLPPENHLFADNAQLSAIMGYHIVLRLAVAADLMDLVAAVTLLGQDVTFHNANGINVNEAHIINADIEADNGIIHIIDAVLMPRL